MAKESAKKFKSDCPECGTEIKTNRESQTYCSPRCRQRAWFKRTYERKAKQ